jgi:signal transduction histidine kinase
VCIPAYPFAKVHGGLQETAGDYTRFPFSCPVRFDDITSAPKIAPGKELRLSTKVIHARHQRCGKRAKLVLATEFREGEHEPMTTIGGSSSLTPEEQVAVLQRQLAQAQKLTALGELVSTTTHEFNNVLMTIINYAKLGMRHKDEASRNKAFEKILAAGERAAKITNAVLGMARNRSDAFEPTDLAAIVQESLVLLERELRKYRISVETQFGSAPPAHANGNQIQQVLLNLLINARQAMPDGGRVLIKVDYDPAQNMVEWSIRDTGSGIAPDKLQRIFDPFFSTKKGPDKSGKGGTGLGLSTCRNIIESHRGRIRVESTVGVGTAFTIKLPAYKQRTSIAAPILQAGGVAATGTAAVS